jgi:hypothetical protein
MVRISNRQAALNRARQTASYKADKQISGEELLDKHYFHEAERMNQRTDWFLIFHAILMEAFFSIGRRDIASIIVVGSVGLLLSFLWLISGLRAGRMASHLGNMIGREMGRDASEMHHKIFSERQQFVNSNPWWGWTRFLPLFGVVIPVIFVIAWITLIVFRIPGDHMPTLLYILGSSLLAVLIIGIGLTKIVEPVINRVSK